MTIPGIIFHRRAPLLFSATGLILALTAAIALTRYLVVVVVVVVATVVVVVVMMLESLSRGCTRNT